MSERSMRLRHRAAIVLWTTGLALFILASFDWLRYTGFIVLAIGER